MKDKSTSEEEMKKVNIKGVILDQISDMPFIILETENKKKTFSLGIGPAEASAIIIALEGIRTPRPLTHDLFAHFLLRHNFIIDKVEIYDMIDSKYFARLFYHKGLRKFKLELRPSDALALAVRLRSPIFVKQKLIQEQAELFELHNSDKHFDLSKNVFGKNDLEFFG